MTVTAEKEKKPKEGSAEAGYKSDTVDYVGPWGEKAILDTPYSISVIPGDLIKNTNSNNTDNVFRMNPGIQLLQPYEFNGLTRVMMRGFLIQNQMIDGIQGDTPGEGLFIENMDRIEVLNGLSGFMYGVGNVGGTLNYVTKQPTSVPFHELTIGDYGGGQYFAHADLGGPIDKQGKFAYRLNFMTQSGDTPIQDQSVNRYMLSGAFDWHILDNLKVGIDAMDGHDRVDGRQGQWLFAPNLARIPSPPDSSHLWASPDTFNLEDTIHYGAHLTWDISDMLTFRSGYGHHDMTRQTITSQNRITSITNYTQNAAGADEWEDIEDGGFTYMDVKFGILGVNNKVTFGWNGWRYVSRDGLDTNGNSFFQLGSTRTNLSLSDPDSANVTLPNFDFDALKKTKDFEQTSKNAIIGDDIKFTDQWEALVGVNYSEWIVQYFPTSYDKTKATPTFSLLYKPIPYVTTYATYIESLTQGAIVSSSGGQVFTNNGEIFPPYVSKQYEVGAKAELGKMLLTGAVFDIEKANTYVQDNGNGTFTEFQNGKEVHKGVELTISGKVTNDLTLLGGITQMTCNVEKSTNGVGVGKIPQGIADQMAKLYAEYDLPFVRGLTLTGGVYYTGKSYFNVQNTQVAPSYVTGDFGARYTTKLYGYNTTFRGLVANVTDKSYWMSNATVGGIIGAPRTFSLTASVQF